MAIVILEDARVCYSVFFELSSFTPNLSKAGLAKFIRSVTQFSGGRMARNLAQACSQGGLSDRTTPPPGSKSGPLLRRLFER